MEEVVAEDEKPEEDDEEEDVDAEVEVEEKLDAGAGVAAVDNRGGGPDRMGEIRLLLEFSPLVFMSLPPASTVERTVENAEVEEDSDLLPKWGTNKFVEDIGGEGAVNA